jgi:hypothetical protein
MPHPRSFIPAFSQKSMITSSTTTPSKIEKLVSGVKAANVTPLGGGLVLVLLVLLLNISPDTLQDASALTGVLNRGMIELRALCVCA